jgi:transposase
MDERLRFIARLLEGESVSDLCREAGISRKAGYKILNRYKEEGATAITERSSRPYRYANQLPPQLEAMIVGLKKDKPHWGARKLRELLLRRRCPKRPLVCRLQRRVQARQWQLLLSADPHRSRFTPPASL